MTDALQPAKHVSTPIVDGAPMPTGDPAPEGREAKDLARTGLRTMTRNTMLFAAGALAGKVVGLVMLPVLTRLLTPSELGYLDVLMTLSNTLITALQLGLDVAALRLYFDKSTTASQRALLASWFAISMGVSIVTGTVLVLGSAAISQGLFATDRLQLAVVSVAVAIVGGTAQLVVLTILRARGRAGSYALLNVGALALYAALATVLLVTWRADAAAVVASWAISLTVVMVVGTTMLRRDLFRPPSSEAARRLLRLGLPLAPAIVGMLISEFLVRLTLLRVAGADQVAYFTVGNRFASVAALSLAVLQLAWVPRAYAIAEDGDPSTHGRIGREGTWIVALVALAVLVVAAGSRVMVTVVAGSAYLAALPPLGLSLVAVVALAVYLIASMPSAVARRTEDLALATALAAIIGVVGTVLLAEPLQAIGAAGSLAVGQIAAVAMVGMLGLRRPSLGIEWRRVLPIAVATSCATLVLVTDAWLPLRVAAGLAAVAVIALSVRLPEGMRVVRRALGR